MEFPYKSPYYAHSSKRDTIIYGPEWVERREQDSKETLEIYDQEKKAREYYTRLQQAYPDDPLETPRTRELIKSRDETIRLILEAEQKERQDASLQLSLQRMWREKQEYEKSLEQKREKPDIQSLLYQPIELGVFPSRLHITSHLSEREKDTNVVTVISNVVDYSQPPPMPSAPESRSVLAETLSRSNDPPLLTPPLSPHHHHVKEQQQKEKPIETEQASKISTTIILPPPAKLTASVSAIITTTSSTEHQQKQKSGEEPEIIHVELMQPRNPASAFIHKGGVQIRRLLVRTASLTNLRSSPDKAVLKKQGSAKDLKDS